MHCQLNDLEFKCHILDLKHRNQPTRYYLGAPESQFLYVRAVPEFQAYADPT